jgi:purine-binding chemotaxis protein CheW
MVKDKIEDKDDNKELKDSDVSLKGDDNELAIDSDDMCKFLTFKVDNEIYGVDLLSIREIKGWSETTRLPNSPSFMKGVINLRGAVIPIFDLKGRFNMGQTQATEKHVVIILAVGERLVGILVDAVSDIIDVPNDDIKQAPQMETKLDDKFVKGLISIEEKMVVVLDIETLFDSSDIQIEGNLQSDISSD